ncbi:MAG: isocitrate lyase/PEP mutase family protein [Alphaproteobacteria bacterium]
MTKSFRELHCQGKPFILANAWDKGSACLFAGLGAEALGTSSGAHAFSMGRSDLGNITRDEALSHAQDIISATTLPVSGDFENGFGDTPDVMEETVKLSAEIGLSGISIEDISYPDNQAYEFDLAVERIHAASSKAKSISKDFVLVARADGFMHELYDLDESIRRIQAFEAAGADCVYVPFISDLEAVTRVCNSVSVPVNVGIETIKTISMTQLADANVARVSLGMAMAIATFTTIHKISSDMFDRGDFSKFCDSHSYELLDDCISKGRAS